MARIVSLFFLLAAVCLANAETDVQFELALPEGVPSTIAEIKRLNEAGETEKAFGVSCRLVEEHPECIEGHTWKAYFQKNEKNYEEALQTLESAFRYVKDDKQARAKLHEKTADLCVKRKLHGRALANYRLAMEYRPDSLECELKHCAAYGVVKDWKTAKRRLEPLVNRLRKAVEEEPSQSSMRMLSYATAKHALACGMTGEIEKAFRILADMDPNELHLSWLRLSTALELAMKARNLDVSEAQGALEAWETIEVAGERQEVMAALTEALLQMSSGEREKGLSKLREFAQREDRIGESARIVLKLDLIGIGH